MTEAAPALAALPASGFSLRQERLIIAVVGAIQFVNILDFMIVMPMGPDLAAGLAIDTSQIGLIGGAYTASAAVSGLVGSWFLDRFDRRPAIALAMVGLLLGTLLGAFATGLWTLLAARVIAGCFGGPATSLALAVIADTVPQQRRGRALGAVMAAFSAASVLGVPAGLELSRLFGWRSPFIAVTVLGALVGVAAFLLLPSLRGHLQRGNAATSPAPLLNPITVLSLVNTALVMMGVFAVVPNVAAFIQHNLGYPREGMGLLYMVGGLVSLVTTQLGGLVVDRVGSTRLVILGTVVHVAALMLGFIWPQPSVPVMLVFVLFMLSGSVRMVPLQVLASKVPRPEQRASFMSAQSATQHLASAIGAGASSLVLVAEPSGRLRNLEWVCWAALGAAVLVPFGVALVERWVTARNRGG